MLSTEALDIILHSSSRDESVLAAFAALQLPDLDAEMLNSALERIRQSADIHPDLGVELHELGRFAFDCSGTGGSGIAHFNTSTSTAFVLAAAGYKIAKFGGRAASGKSGSFDFLECLGISSKLPLHVCADALSVCGIAFIFAPEVYPGLRRLAPLRKQFGKPTLLNYIGPLLNPLRPRTRLMGISSDQARILLAQHLCRDKMTEKAILVTAGGRFDEFAIDVINEVSLIDEEKLHEFQLDSSCLPFQDDPINGADPVAVETELDAKTNLRIFNEIIEGNDLSSPHYKMLLLNAAGGLFVLQACKSIGEGINIAANLIAEGAVAESLATCRRFYEKLSC